MPKDHRATIVEEIGRIAPRVHQNILFFISAALASTLTPFAAPALAATLYGQVVGVSDGDTVTVLVDGHSQVHVRIAGIDAPEKRQPYGQRSKQLMSDCAFGKEVAVEWKKIDRYGRTVGKVVSKGVDCGLRQIELGMAWHYKTYAKDQSREDREAYAEAEERARAKGRGLWSDADPVPPWQYRHGRSRSQ